MWIIFAVLSAVFAALTSILAKIGIEGVDSNQDSSSCYYGMGNGIFHACAKGFFRNKPEKLVVFNSVRPGNRRIMALLL